MTDRYVVFGNPVAHSKSPLIHALFAKQTGQDMVYEAQEVPLGQFADVARAFRDGGGAGANVTVPFKEDAFHLVKRMTDRARAAGAVNTLYIVGNRIRGDNTDGAGLLADIKTNLGFSVHGKRILIIGAGGAARGAMLPLLEEMPASLTIANRTEEKAQRLAQEFSSFATYLIADPALQPKKGGRPPQMPVIGTGFDGLYGKQFDLIINATSTGLSGEALPLMPEVFAPDCLAYDMMYGRETPFMTLAKEAGAKVSDGLGMLVEQAAEAFFVWRGIRPDTAPVMEALRQG